MNLTRSEQATLHFYKWERWGRGYYLFETPIEIEPPYQRFQHKRTFQESVIDDGRVPSLLTRAINLIAPSEETKIKELPEIVPQYLSIDAVPKLVAFSLSFSIGQEIQPRVCQEFLGVLSYTNHPISFEIVGTQKEISIQIVCSEQDEDRVSSQLKAYFPLVQILSTETDLPFDDTYDIAICDFGLNDEFMRPIQASDNFRIDPLTSIIATMETLKEGDVVVFQMIFKGVTAPWSCDMLRSVSDGTGGSFFANAPEMLPLAKEKASSPLFSALFRIGTQGQTEQRSSYLASELARSITGASRSESNQLIPLSNEGYKYDFHWYNLLHRTSNRLGCIVNVKELATFVHYPNNTVVSAKLGIQSGTTKEAPREYVDAKYFIGTNEHQRQRYNVGLTEQARLRHTHVIGATGVGKSTLLANMVITDAKLGNGCAMFDPHGDIVEDIMARIPEHRLNDVILIDPSDTEYPVGFNLLHATTEAEKIVLSSDLTGAFKRFATAWGDNMSAVLQQAINAFLDSSKGGTLIELKRFLLEQKFREQFLETVDDPSIHYYWQYEYPMVKKGIAPLLTRIDTFLRPKIVRYMLAQKGGVDFRVCIEEKKIVLIKLSQGLIGAENSYLLGSLFLSKFNQIALGRQNLSKQERHPFYIYCDEFQNFITDSISSILSGARKYGLGLTLAHQELAQIDDTKVLNSVISNPFTRICFRLGDTDAKKLASGFSAFSEEDLQSLGVGEAVMRIGSSTNDCNVTTLPLEDIDRNLSATKRKQIVSSTRDKYGMPKEDVERLLEELLPKISKKKDIKTKEQPQQEKTKPTQEVPVVAPAPNIEVPKVEEEKAVSKPSDDSEVSQKKKAYLEQLEKQEQVKRHREIQNFIQTITRQRGFKTEIEKPTKTGGRVDVALTHKKTTIAIEVAVTNSIDYEVQNVQKCLSDNYSYIYVLSESSVHLKNIQQRLKAELPKTNSNIFFLQPQEFIQHLDSLDIFKTKQERKIQGYRVKTDFSDDRSLNSSVKQNEIDDMIIKSMRNKKE